MAIKTQRIRDPIHDIIAFDGADEFERTLWQVVQTPPFQRLRRVKQLGFSELVFPGATHTRFAHSLGVFHTARQLMRIIVADQVAKGLDVQTHRRNVALAAALVHDVGHGMFSHAFEEVGEKLGIKAASHENVTSALIKETPLREAFTPLGRSFADEVADLIAKKTATTVYDAVVSSQFDADRLYYMQRDRFMTGQQGGGVDLAWLVNNLAVGEVTVSVDELEADKVETLVLQPKALHAAETFVLSLFQLYPTIYFHKATRGAEKLFGALFERIFILSQDSADIERTGLSTRHPIIQFCRNADDLRMALLLDDAVFWGALGELATAKDPVVAALALRMRDRQLPKSFDIREHLSVALCQKHGLSRRELRHGRERDGVLIDFEDEMMRLEGAVAEEIDAAGWTSVDGYPRLLLDRAERAPYKEYQDSKGLLNQILIQTDDGNAQDIHSFSPFISRIASHKVFRAYADPLDTESLGRVKRVVEAVVSREPGDESQSPS